MSEERTGYDDDEQDNTRFNFSDVADTRPLPSEEAADNIDGDNLSDVQRFAAAVGTMPSAIAHAVCRAIGRLDSFSSLHDIARVSGVSISTLYRHIRGAAELSKALKAPPLLGSPRETEGHPCTQWGDARSATNEGKEKKGKQGSRQTVQKTTSLFPDGGGDDVA